MAKFTPSAKGVAPSGNGEPGSTVFVVRCARLMLPAGTWIAFEAIASPPFSTPRGLQPRRLLMLLCQMHFPAVCPYRWARDRSAQHLLSDGGVRQPGRSLCPTEPRHPSRTSERSPLGYDGWVVSGYCAGERRVLRCDHANDLREVAR